MGDVAGNELGAVGDAETFDVRARVGKTILATLHAHSTRARQRAQPLDEYTASADAEIPQQFAGGGAQVR